MKDKRDSNNGGSFSVNPSYAVFQIAKALRAAEQSNDPATLERSNQKAAKWETVLGNILSGKLAYGSRTPVGGVPSWATLEVVTGGFATGELLAAGPLQEHEKKILKNFADIQTGTERGILNAYFLSEPGLAELQSLLESGCYDVAVPEEGAFLVVAWLVENGHTTDARKLLDELAPFFSALRFYPVPLDQPRSIGSRIHLQDVGRTLADIRRIKANERILAQKESVEVWLPLYDRIVALFLETVEKDWPCQKYPNAWTERALALLGEYSELRKEHKLCSRFEKTGGHAAQLREFLGKCARNPEALNGREVGRIRLILNRYLAKRGKPDSISCNNARNRQLKDVSAPTFHSIAAVVASRLEKLPKNEGQDVIDPLNEAITEQEEHSELPKGTSIPPSIQRKVERCLNDTVSALIERGLITSGDTLAKCLPQMTSGIRAMGVDDTSLRKLYATIYRAFRQRRSLLLVNLEKQVQIEELPWVAAIERFRCGNLGEREVAKQTLEEVAVLTLTSFPYAIFPNKLLQEFRGLVKSAELDIPLVDELATDIFMGEFSEKFVDAAWRASDLLKDSLYAAYYGIDYELIRNIPKRKPKVSRPWSANKNAFADICASRAGVALGTWSPATNGMIVEQQQVLTTQNLAALFAELKLVDMLRNQLGGMAKRCFAWICHKQQLTESSWRAKLKMIKNTAYAWRQMIFYLSLISEEDIAEFFVWAEAHLGSQEKNFRDQFSPALRGLLLVAKGGSLDNSYEPNARRFLGWSDKKHWLLSDPSPR